MIKKKKKERRKHETEKFQRNITKHSKVNREA